MDESDEQVVCDGDKLAVDSNGLWVGFVSPDVRESRVGHPVSVVRPRLGQAPEVQLALDLGIAICAGQYGHGADLAQHGIQRCCVDVFKFDDVFGGVTAESTPSRYP